MYKIPVSFYLMLDSIKKLFSAGRQWLMPVILGSQESKIRRITVSKPAWANSLLDPISKNPSQ
jgi:hypothetical protein